METLKKKMSQSTIMDEELIENQGNNLTVLPSSLKAYRRWSHSLLDGLELHRRSDSCEIETEVDGSRDPDQVSDKQDGLEAVVTAERKKGHQCYG